MRSAELLCLLARTEPDSRAVFRSRALLQGPIDWDLVIERASLHRVLPLFYRNLNKLASSDVPQPALSRLREAYLRNAARNLRLAGRLKEICAILDENGIETAPFKGPVLAQEVFGDVALRQFNDLDVLVPKEAAWSAVKELEARGFVPEIPLTASRFRSYAARNKSLPMVDTTEQGFFLDLHWDLGGDYARAPMTYDSFREGLEAVELLGASFKTLGRKDLLIYLCLHAAMESWSRLDHMCCVAELIKGHPEVLRRETYEEAGRLRLRRCLLAGCFLARIVLDAPVPDFLLERIERDGHVKAYAGDCIRRLFDRAGPESDEGERPKFSGRHMLLKDGPAERFRHMLFLLASPTIEDWRRMPVPGGLGFVLYGYRPLRLAVECMRRKGRP